MTKEEYIIEIKSISEQQEALKAKEDDIKYNYLLEHCPVRGGDKVKVLIGSFFGEGVEEHIAFIHNCWVNYVGEINYSLYKAKKDGSISSQKLNHYGKIKSVELIESAKPQ